MTFTSHEPAASEVSSGAAGSPAPVPAIRVEHLTKHFTRRGEKGSAKRKSANENLITPVNDVSFDVAAGEFVVLLGPSGCGKTTLLRCVAGLERPDDGVIQIDGTTMYSGAAGQFVPAQRRPISMIFQSYALWPHMTVFENVAYPLRTRGLRGAVVTEKVMTILGIVGLSHLARQHPAHISGGEQQRVAVARAIAVEANVVLFDEPLSNVDAKVREQLRVDLKALQRELGFTALYVTHDQGEALELADRIAVLRAGVFEQFGRPSEVYDSPASLYVADFLGSANIMRGEVASVSGGTVEVRTPSGLTAVGSWTGAEPPKRGDAAGAIFRPEHTSISAGTKSRNVAPNRWAADLIADLYQGSHVEYVAMCGESRLRAWIVDGAISSEATAVEYAVPTEHVQILPASASTP